VLLVASMMYIQVDTVNPLEGGMAQRLLSQRDELIQAGLSYITGDPTVPSGLSLDAIVNISTSHQVSCVINLENWSKWLLSYPVYYFRHGTFHSSFHDRDVFPGHREAVVVVNSKDTSFTGTSGTLAWELEEQGVHLIIMWSVPYNLNIYNSYFGVGVVQLTTRFTRDMLPYWYNQMINHKLGRTFQRGREGESLTYKHEDFFVIADFSNGYHPVLNISVMPWQTRDLPASMWHTLYVNSLRTTAAAFSRCGKLMPNLVLPISLLLLAFAILFGVR